MNGLKLTEELAADIRARVKGLDFGAIEKLAKAKDQNGTFDVIISTEDTDRAGEIVKQSGWELANYKNNPIVLWGHDYYSLPVGVCTETYLTEKNGVPALGAKGVFLSADINPFAQQVRKLYEFGIGKGAGVGCTTSVGFIPKEFDDQARNTITKAELLEFSFVPIPANQGVGPAAGRSITFEEAKELDLDVAGLTLKGIQFAEVEQKDEDGTDTEKKEAQAGDDCSMDDGTAGELASDPDNADGPLVCIPKDNDKAKAADRKPEKELIKSLHDEHARHTDEVEKALDAFRDGTGEEASPDVLSDALKDLRSSLEDEHTMHRAKATTCLRGFQPELKTLNKKTHLKALREEDDGYAGKCKKALDLFEERCGKAQAEEIDGLTDALSTELEGHARAHKKAVTKLAKALCREAFGEEEQVDPQMVDLLKEYLAPHVDPQMLNAVSLKVGARISAASKERLREAHEHMKAASVIVEALHGNLGDGGGEEGRGDGDEKSAPTKAPETKRSRPAGDASGKDELEAHLFARDVLRGITTAATRGLEKINEQVKEGNRRGK
jgi:hemerythrin